MSGTLDPLVQLADAEPLDVARFGGKGARLALLHQAGFTVPEAALLPSDALEDVLRPSPVQAILRSLNRATTDSGVLEQLSAQLLDVLEEAVLPPQLSGKITEWSRAIGPVAVRSSSAREDGSQQAGAGLYDTVLGVSTPEDIESAVIRVVASQFSPHAIAYWRGELSERNEMAVVLQRMLSPRASGVVFTCDPVTGNRNVAVLEACFGVGTSVVDGSGIAQRTTVRLSDYFVVSTDLRPPKQSVHFDQSEGRLIRTNGPGAIATEVLSTSEIHDLIESAIAIDTLIGSPVDVEWSIEDETLSILQARPVTAIGAFP